MRAIDGTGGSQQGTPAGQAAGPRPSLRVVSDRAAELVEFVEQICRFGPRPPASSAERACASWLADYLTHRGASVTRLPFVSPRLTYWARFGHLVAYLFCIGWAASHLMDGIILAALVVYSYWGDLGGRFHTFRRLLPRGESFNVVAKARGPKVENGADGKVDPAAPPRKLDARIVLTASIDSGRSGFFYEPGRARFVRGLFRRRLGWKLAPYYWQFFVMMAGVAAVSARFVLRHVRPQGLLPDWLALMFRIADVASLAVLLAVLAATVVAALIMVNIAVSGRDVTGANGNASGVATATMLFDEWRTRLPAGAELQLVVTGASNSGLLGMRRYWEKYGDEFDRRRTWFLNFDHVGAGDVKIVMSEGWVTVVPYPREMALFARRALGADFASRETYNLRAATEGIVPATEGFNVLTLTALDATNTPVNYHSLTDTPDAVDPATIGEAYELGSRLIDRVLFEAAEDRRRFEGGLRKLSDPEDPAGGPGGQAA